MSNGRRMTCLKQLIMANTLLISKEMNTSVRIHNAPYFAKGKSAVSVLYISVDLDYSSKYTGEMILFPISLSILKSKRLSFDLLAFFSLLHLPSSKYSLPDASGLTTQVLPVTVRFILYGSGPFPSHRSLESRLQRSTHRHPLSLPRNHLN